MNMITNLDSEYPDYSVTPEDASSLIESLKPIRRKTRMGAIVLAFTVAVGSILPTDIAIGKANIEHSEPSVHVIAEPIDPDTTDSPLTYLDGYARQDSSWEANKMLGALPEITGSEINAIEYSEKGIHIDAIALKIAEHAKSIGAASVILYGYSIGGDDALLVAGVLIHKYDIQVKEIYLDHTPANIDDIASGQREMAASVIDTVKFFESIGIELQHSWIIRQLVNQSTPESTSYTDQVSSSLLIGQLDIIASMNTKQAFANLKSDKYPTPVVINMSSDSDNVINLTQADSTFDQAATDSNVPYSSLAVESTIHGRPDYVVDSYKDVLAEARPNIDAQVNQAETLHRMQSGSTILMRIQFRK